MIRMSSRRILSGRDSLVLPWQTYGTQDSPHLGHSSWLRNETYQQGKAVSFFPLKLRRQFSEKNQLARFSETRLDHVVALARTRM